MFIELQETDIATRLATFINDTGVLIGLLPETEKDFKRVFTKPDLAVCYGESDFGKAPDTSPQIYQDEEETFNVVIRARKLRGTLGVWDLADKCRRALIGFKPSHCQEGMYVVKFAFLNREPEKEFAYIMVFKVMSTVVQDYTEPDEVQVSELNFDQTITG